jgi:hypothetical protein
MLWCPESAKRNQRLLAFHFVAGGHDRQTVQRRCYSKMDIDRPTQHAGNAPKATLVPGSSLAWRCLEQRVAWVSSICLQARIGSGQFAAYRSRPQFVGPGQLARPVPEPHAKRYAPPMHSVRPLIRIDRVPVLTLASAKTRRLWGCEATQKLVRAAELKPCGQAVPGRAPVLALTATASIPRCSVRAAR